MPAFWTPLVAGIFGGFPVPLVGVLDISLANLLLLGVAVVPWPSSSRATPNYTDGFRLRPCITVLARLRSARPPREEAGWLLTGSWFVGTTNWLAGIALLGPRRGVVSWGAPGLAVNALRRLWIACAGAVAIVIAVAHLNQLISDGKRVSKPFLALGKWRAP